jgi:cell division protein FtsX
VEEVDWGRGWAERLAKLSRMAEGGLAVVLAALFSGSLLLVGGVVRFAVHARRDEIEVLELLGASDAFIRLPFLLEGMFAGAVGGGYAASALLGFAAWEARLTAALPLPEEISVAAWAGGGAALGLVAAGALLGLFATVFALARELR